ncbi:hypothetical protein [Cytobacillus purgationiresistens]|uniref:Septum formation initiator n=1 Tax=Cytobacillus purgationiresistens TaxID=863449 RepID=A0ABU0AQ43_9BACI|nr:hypothetical protein [Cytobacillus purgationiresistens]MDQ0273150.1 hypothetical protein [Cytobacillus purgationiresistens]
MTGIVAVVMVFSIPIIAIVSHHFQAQTKVKAKMIENQLELEKLKNENYMLETERMRIDLEKQLKIEDHKEKFI